MIVDLPPKPDNKKRNGACPVLNRYYRFNCRHRFNLKIASGIGENYSAKTKVLIQCSV